MNAVDVLADAVARAKLYDGQLSALGQMVADKAIELHRCRFESFAAVAELIDCNNATIRAFEALGRSNGIGEQLETHRECERALVAQKAALARVGGAK